LDIFNLGVANPIFDVEIWNVLQDYENTTLRLTLTQNSVSIASIESDPFKLPKPVPTPAPSSPSYRASNIDIVNTHTIPGSGIVFVLQNKVNLPDNDFQKTLAGSGRIERGNYILEFRLDNPAWAPGEVQAELRLEITNPSLIQLQYPGDMDVIQTEFPFFQFESDAMNFSVYVYKRINPDDDVETVLSGHPALEFATNLKQFSYNISDGEPLQSGATYFWYVKAIVHTTSGLEEFSSNVRQFTVNTKGEVYRKINLSLLLEPLLGDQARTMARNLADFDLKTIKVNGKIVSLEELFQIINEYQRGAFDIKDLVLE